MRGDVLPHTHFKTDASHLMARFHLAAAGRFSSGVPSKRLEIRPSLPILTTTLQAETNKSWQWSAPPAHTTPALNHAISYI